MGLKDNTLLDKITSDIKSEVIRLVGDGSACAKLLNKEYKDISDSFRVEFVCKNGYLSVFMSLSDSKGANRAYASVMYDLINGEELEFSDMFAPRSNFILGINGYVRDYSAVDYEPGLPYTDFIGIEADVAAFDFGSVASPAGGIYAFGCGSFSFEPDYRYFIPAIPRAMDGIWNDAVKVTCEYCSVAAAGFCRANGAVCAQFEARSGLLDADIKRYNDFIIDLANSRFENAANGTDIPYYDASVFAGEYLVITVNTGKYDAETFVFSADTLKQTTIQ